MKRARGFTLLEALIALLIIAIGLLGIASMQAASVYRAHVGTLNGLAAVEAQSIAANITANQSAFPTGATTFAYNTTDAYAVTYSTACNTANCNPDEMAAYDLKQWGNEIRTNLPQGKGEVNCVYNASSPPECTVTVKWAQKEMAPPATTTRHYSIVVRP